MEQGQNKLRYLQDLKERVILNTDQNGIKIISEETKALKSEFETLMTEVHDVKTNLSSRFDLLGDLEKTNKLVLEWIEDSEGKIKNDVADMLIQNSFEISSIPFINDLIFVRLG